MFWVLFREFHTVKDLQGIDWSVNISQQLKMSKYFTLLVSS